MKSGDRRDICLMKGNEWIFEESLTYKTFADKAPEVIDILRKLLYEPTIINIDTETVERMEQQAAAAGRKISVMKDSYTDLDTCTRAYRLFLEGNPGRNVIVFVAGDFDKAEFTRAMDGIMGWESPDELAIGVLHVPASTEYVTGGVAY